MFSFYFKMQPSERGTCKRLNYLQILKMNCLQILNTETMKNEDKL